MAHTKILPPGCSSNFSLFQLSILDDPLDHLSELKFDGEDATPIIEHIFYFLKFCKSYEIDDDEFDFLLFYLTLESHVNQWCYTFPLASIHSLHQFLRELHQAFDRYNYCDVCKRINLLRMKPIESVEDFYDRFLHLCCEIFEEDMNQDFLKQEFEHLVLISLQGELKPPDFSTPSTLVNHETPLILEEESTTPFSPCPPPFLVSMWVPPCDNKKVKKSTNQTPNPPSHYSSIHDSYSMKIIIEWLMKPMVNTNSSIP